MRLFLIVAMLFLAGCANPLSGLFVSKGQKEKEIAALKIEYDKKLSEAQSAQDVALKKLMDSKNKQLSGAANAFYGQDVVFRSIVAPTRTDLITHNLAMEGWAAVGVQPTFEDMQRMNERLLKELDETKTSLADLQRNHQAALAQNQQLADQARKHQEELNAAIEARRKIQDEYDAKLAAKQAELIVLQDKLIAAEKAASDEKKARQAQIAKLSWGSGIIAALCIAGAIYSPVSKRELIIGAAVFGGAAVALPFLEMWHVMTAIGIVLAAICGRVLYKYRKEERVNEALILANQDIKDCKPDVWKNEVAPIVEDRLKKYVKKNGKLVLEKDPSIEAHIDAKLAEYEALGPVPTKEG